MRKTFLKRATATTMACLIVLSGSVPAAAAPAYKDLEKQMLERLADGCAKTWDQDVDRFEEKKESGGEGAANLTLHLEEAGRSLLGLFASVNIAWLENIGLSVDAAAEGSTESAIARFKINDTTILSLEAFLDFASKTGHICLPELSESLLDIDQETLQENMPDQAWQSFQEGLNAEELLEAVPDGDTVGSLLKDYGDIIISHMEEGEVSEETILVEGVEKKCTVCEGLVFEQNLREMSEEILNRAKEDEQLKEIIESWDNIDTGSDNLYGTFLDSVNEGLKELSEAAGEAEEDTYIRSRLWLDEEEKVVGREISFYSEGENDGNLTWYNVKDGDDSGFQLAIDDPEGDRVALCGSGKTTDGLLDGYYEMQVNEEPQLGIQVEDYDVESVRGGGLKGAYTLTLLAGANEDGSGDMFSNLGLRAEFVFDKETKEHELHLALLSADVLLATLSLEFEEKADLAAFSDSGKRYNPGDQDDMDAYMSEWSFDTIVENCLDAGIPREIMEMLVQSLASNAADPGLDLSGSGADASGFALDGADSDADLSGSGQDSASGSALE